MTKVSAIVFGLFLVNNLSSQTYSSFPTDTAEWNCLFWHQWSANDFYLYNSSYLLEGDTNLNGISYKKVYYTETDIPDYNPEYIGGLRENDTKEIYFFPVSEDLLTLGPISFPNDTAEHLLYTFNNLETGMILPINEGKTMISVVGTDSVLMGNSYHKRYTINQQGLFGYDYWIEGIGSVKDLLVPFSYEFEWEYFTLCFTDTITYYINAPNGADSCHFSLPVGLNELEKDVFSVFPNPASNKIHIRKFNSEHNVSLRIYNASGQVVLQRKVLKSGDEIDIENLHQGVYFVEITLADRKQYTKLIKE